MQSADAEIFSGFYSIPGELGDAIAAGFAHFVLKYDLVEVGSICDMSAKYDAEAFLTDSFSKV